jgi:predicted RNA-binding Zn-ribbon protein involved in translation (DUF1610 family)
MVYEKNIVIFIKGQLISYIMEEKLICSSCKKRISNNPGMVKFKCPECGKAEIVRCKSCRKNAAKYKCECGFQGPN